MGTHMTTPVIPAESKLRFVPLLFAVLASFLLQIACGGGDGQGVRMAPPANLTYSSSSAAYTTGADITPNRPSSQGGAILSYAVAPALPAGLTLNTGTGVITGRPTAITAEATYVVTARNLFGSTTASLLLKVNPPAPVITTQPASQDISYGQTATFSVVASGTGELSYQWQKDGTDIPGAEGATYTTPASTQPAVFKVVVKDGYGGQVESQEARLGILPGSLVQVQPLNVGRYDHAAVLLQDNRTLIVGGRSSAGPLATLEIYDPATQSFTALTATLGQARVCPTATLLANGNVLILGGWNPAGGYVAAAEIYNPAANTVTALGNMLHPRARHTATLLGDGTVLVVGGTDGSPVAQMEYFDPGTTNFLSAGTLNTARFFHSASLLPDGTVLVAGGWDGGASLDTAELYTPSPSHASDSVSLLPNRLVRKRYLHTATVLADGRVLLSGGIGAGGTLGTAELYTPATGLFTATGDMKAPRQIHGALLLGDGTVLIASGWNGSGVLTSFERYDPTTGQFTLASGPSLGFHSPTATLLGDGKVLFVGGYRGGALAGAFTWGR